MKIIELTQGSPEWHAHRAQHFNASDAPAMMSCSPYTTRSELLRRMATGYTPEVSAGTQALYDSGHRFEALARPLAETLIGEELFPVVGSEGRLSASFDGLTLSDTTIWEHKRLNQSLRAAMPADGIGDGADLPLHYRVQMEHQMAVALLAEVLFTASDWDQAGNLIEIRHARYCQDPALRAQILAGWDQFALDLANYQPEDAAPKAIGHAPENLPALRIELRGEVMASNLEPFKEHALAVFRGINRNLSSDQDFADAERTVKWCQEVEDKLAAAKKAALAQTSSIEELFAAIDTVAAEARRVRLDLDKLVKTRKDDIRAGILMDAKAALAAYVAELNGGLLYPVPVPAVDFAAAIKGKRSLDSIKDAVVAELVKGKFFASAQAEVVKKNTKTLGELTPDASLTYDLKTLILKSPEDFEALLRSRIAQRAVELQAKALQDKLLADQAQAEAASREALTLAQTTGMAVVTPSGKVAGPADVYQAPEEPTMSVGAISTRLGFNVTQKFLEELGIKARVKQGNAVLYRESDFFTVCTALVKHVNRMAAEAREAA
jgi:putative phage-type endonuclease